MVSKGEAKKIDPDTDTATPAEPAVDLGHPGRNALEAAKIRSAPAMVRQPTSAEKSAAFAAQVRERAESSRLQGAKITNGAAHASRSITPGRMRLAEHEVRTFCIYPELGTTPDDMLVPAYWAHISRNLRARDHLIIDAEDGSWYAEARILETGTSYARIAFKPGHPQVVQVSEPDVDMTVPPGYEIKWLGPNARYAVVRGPDRLKDSFQNKGLAAAWLREHLQVIGRSS